MPRAPLTARIQMLAVTGTAASDELKDAASTEDSF